MRWDEAGQGGDLLLLCMAPMQDGKCMLLPTSLNNPAGLC